MKVLFIGNSHTYFNDMPHLFQEICKDNGITADVTMITHGGKGFDFHKDQEEVRFNILYGNYDYFVLQHSAHPFGPEKVMFESAKAIDQFICQTKAQKVLYMTWSEKVNEAGQERMAKAYYDLGEMIHAKVAPVGLVWWDYRHKYPAEELYYTDGEHASKTGSLLAAATIFSVISGKKASVEDAGLQKICDEAYEGAQRYGK